MNDFDPDELEREAGVKPEEKVSGNNSDKSASDSFATRDESVLSAFGARSSAFEETLKGGFLVLEDKKKQPYRIIESHAAKAVASALKGCLAWDASAKTWLMWVGTHWVALEPGAEAESLIAKAVEIGTRPIGYRPGYLAGVTRIIQVERMLPPPRRRSGAIPFRNGLLDPKTGKLEKLTPECGADWCLPHEYDKDADCPEIKRWLLRCVEDDAETVELLRAWMAALIRGIRVQKILILIGRGGTGKGVFQRLVVALTGTLNVAVCTLENLEKNRFEVAKLYKKILVMVNEAGKHGGELNMLKAITGGDHLPLERKHVQQTGTFIFEGLALIATNDEIRSTDMTSGLERRRLTVRFPKTVTPEEKADWDSRGGEEKVLHPEIPGLVNWILAMPESEIRKRMDGPPKRVLKDNLLGMAAGNSVADWMLDNTVFEADAWSQTGVKKECRDRENGQTYYEDADAHLYPNYLTWCLENGRPYPVANNSFKKTIKDMAESMGHLVEDGRHPESRNRGLVGIRLRTHSDAEPDGPEREKGHTSPHSERTGRTDRGKTSSETFEEAF